MVCRSHAVCDADRSIAHHTGYGAYQFSSIKKTVDAATTTQAYLQSTKDKVAASVSSAVGDSSPGEALKYLRGVAQSYVSLIPGAGAYVDATFDEFDRVASTHGEEAEKILKGAYEEVQKAYEGAKKKGALDAETAATVADILRRRLGELYKLGKKAGGDVFGEILDKHPELKEKLGGGYEQLQKLAESKGPEAKKMLEDTQKQVCPTLPPNGGNFVSDDDTSQVKEIFAKGFSLDAADQARQLIQSKIEELRNLAEPAAQEAWDKATEQAKPYLDKVPEVREMLDAKSSAFLSMGAAALGGTGAGSAKEIFERVKQVAEAKGKDREAQLKELKSWLEEKAKEAQEGAKSRFGLDWETLLGYVKKVPGGEEVCRVLAALDRTKLTWVFYRL